MGVEAAHSSVSGSSPLTRGKLGSVIDWFKTYRLIPAHAGKTPQMGCSKRERPAHPRSRGENGYLPLSGHQEHGSSPLTRGKQRTGDLVAVQRGLIPAHAGKTRIASPWSSRAWAHPRSRGENPLMADASACVAGSSPLTRGKRGAGIPSTLSPGLIPAHAGKTRSIKMCSCARRAHPRSRGENRGGWGGLGRVWGSSPLTRGKR